MLSSDRTHVFTPYWLNSLSDHDRDDVRQWLTDAGVNINLCPGFDYDGHVITTVYYQVNEMGQATWDKDTNEPIYEDQAREFFPQELPPVPVHRLLKMVRGG